ncbi:regulator of G protein signaling [Multifurca ochricompacta]|uniref:Regulator of G protein signaling n=1 Tax=Multifurca ochricompacta TaxID=376703 RepID=A0AAD4LZX8_9AGAM|nr:regulator of G protein signaling [Multifurca ochricompacta]
MQQDGSPQASSSHMMKTTKRGRPFLKDTLDLFATLIVSLQLTTHKQFFRSFPNSFSTDEAAANLASLKFSQSNRGPDPREPSRVITTTTTTTFSMTRDMAKAMSQHFMDARLIENAADPSSNLFKDRGVYVLTPKGLHVLERFISRNGINGDHLAHVFATQPICMKLLHLERRSVDDEIIVSQSVITALFRRFVGRQANYSPPTTQNLDPTATYHERAKGIQLMDITDRQASTSGKTQTTNHRYSFAALAALEWLCDFTSVVGREEAAEMAAQFVRFGLITLVSDKRKNNDSAIIFTVRGSAPGGNSPVSQTGEFRCTAKAIYRITEEGIRTARWEPGRSGLRDSPNSSSANISNTERSSLEKEGASKSVSAADVKIHRRISLAEKLNVAYTGDSALDKRTKESNTERLHFIIENPTLCHLFRDFLRDNFCEENLAFWLEVQDFKRKFNITSSASSAAFQRPLERPGPGKPHTPGQQAMEQHHETLIQQAYAIYTVYLAPSSQSELNIDHGLRNELSAYLSEVMQGLTGTPFQGRLEADQLSSFNATQLQTMIRLYERIQTHVFRLMATDSVPKFTKTPRFVALRSQNDDFDFLDNDVQYLSNSGPTVPPGLNTDQEVGGAYVTVSQKGTVAAHESRPRTGVGEREARRGWNENAS